MSGEPSKILGPTPVHFLSRGAYIAALGAVIQYGRMTGQISDEAIRKMAERPVYCRVREAKK